MKVKDIAWLAGIIEGEAHFRFQGTPKLQLRMADRDVIERAAKLLDRPVSICFPERKGYKTQYSVNICGTAAIEWMLTVYSLMGDRRKEKIREIVKLWMPQQSHFRRTTEVVLN
jgi:protein-arginine kinase